MKRQLEFLNYKKQLKKNNISGYQLGSSFNSKGKWNSQRLLDTRLKITVTEEMHHVDLGFWFSNARKRDDKYCSTQDAFREMGFSTGRHI
jgi:hypothetical protein